MITILGSKLDDMSDDEKKSVREMIEVLVGISYNTISKANKLDYLGSIYDTHIQSNNLVYYPHTDYDIGCDDPIMRIRQLSITNNEEEYEEEE